MCSSFAKTGDEYYQQRSNLVLKLKKMAIKQVPLSVKKTSPRGNGFIEAKIER
jgi:hypothetical protein